jgi:hypothetical protein
MDGVLADFGAAYREYEERIFGPSAATTRVGDPEEEAAAEMERAERAAAMASERVAAPTASEQRRRRDLVWQAIEETTDFWTSLQPLEPRAVARLHALSLQHRWEVFFITQRPATSGDTVQRQTQRWLVAQGFDLPSVLVISGSRGAAAAALRLDYHVDDSPRNCIEVKAQSGAKPLLVVEPTDETTVVGARKLGIGTASGISRCLEILDQASLARTQPTLLDRLAKLVGWQ